MKNPFALLWRGRQTSPDEVIEDLREHRGQLQHQIRKTDKQIDEQMMRRIREAGLGA